MCKSIARSELSQAASCEVHQLNYPAQPWMKFDETTYSVVSMITGL